MHKLELIKKIKCVFFDFDGVFTDNCVYINEKGEESVKCCRSDGIGIEKLKKLNIAIYILSSEINPVVKQRGKKLNLEVINNCKNKAEYIKQFVKDNNIGFEEIAYVGNDENDLEAIKLVGYSACPADSYPKILSEVTTVLNKMGGEGVVREFCELIVNNRT